MTAEGSVTTEGPVTTTEGPMSTEVPPATEGPLTAREPMADPATAHAAARAIAAAALGRDPGPMATAASGSHHVYVGPDVVVKVIDAASHTRLNREIALAPHLPAGLTAPLLDSGTHRLGAGDLRYACYTRVPGTAPGMGMPGVDAATARALAGEAVERLGRLHAWVPEGDADRTLRKPSITEGSPAGPRSSPRSRASPSATGTKPYLPACSTGCGRSRGTRPRRPVRPSRSTRTATGTTGSRTAGA